MSLNRIHLCSVAAFLILFGSGCGNKAAISTVPEETGWEVIGPGGGGGVMKPTISPFDENFVLTHCDMTAAYLSTDGGKNWDMKNLWNVPDDFEFDPADPNTLYVATRGFRYGEDRGSGFSMVYRSSDKGVHWKIVFPDVKKAGKGFEKLQSYDLNPSEVIDGAIDGTVEKVAVDPADNRKIYLGLAPLKLYIGGVNEQNVDSVMLVCSDDYGDSWSLISRLPGESVRAIFPAGKCALDHEVLVFTESACLRVDELTGKFRQLPLPVKPLVVVEGGLDKSGSLIYIQSAFNHIDGKIAGGMYVSRDQGESWSQVNNGLLEGLPDGKLPRLREGLAVCETQPLVAYISVISYEKNNRDSAGEIYNIYKTVNGGASWEAVLRASSERGYLTGNFEGSWMEKSYNPGWGGAPINLGVAPGNPDICFAGDNGRGYKTVDGGKTWHQIYSHNLSDGSFASGGLDVTTCYGIHFDPFDKKHFFICYTDMGLFHTFNGGQSWHHALTNVPHNWQNTCYEVEFDPDVKGRVWSVWANAHDLPRAKMFGIQGSFVNYEGGVAISDDHGRTWQKSNNGIPDNAVCTNILLDPSSSAGNRTLYVSVFDQGVYKSTDGGKNWKQVFDQRIRVNSAALEPHQSGVIYINTFQNAAFRSSDFGESWKRIEGYRFKWGQRAIPDIHHPGMLYLTTYGGSVFYGPAEGVPGAFEEIENMPENWW